MRLYSPQQQGLEASVSQRCNNDRFSDCSTSTTRDRYSTIRIRLNDARGMGAGRITALKSIDSTTLSTAGSGVLDGVAGCYNLLSETDLTSDRVG
mmetsp:Transcript_16135/g.39717  ORF Transcript_16135/g.39717 Transcript_16135/m.39717 type:complete len:95 (+) Transcript_16135:222-506(+)